VRPLLYSAVALALAALQAALLRQLGGGAVTVCLLAPLLVHLALGAGNVDGVVGAAGVGYVLDLVTGTPKGLLTSLAVAAFLAARLTGAAVHVRGWLGFAALSAAVSLGLSTGAIALLRVAVPPESQPSWALLPRLLLEAGLTGLCAPLLQLGLRRLDAALGSEEPDLVA
jgi:hypothetical protein